MKEPDQLQLFETRAEQQAPAPAPAGEMQGAPPSDDELGIAVLRAVKFAVAKRYYSPLHGLDKEEMSEELIEGTLRRCRKWRSGGPVTLQNFAYHSASKELLDVLKKMKRKMGLEPRPKNSKRKRRSDDYIDAMHSPEVWSLDALLQLANTDDGDDVLKSMKLTKITQLGKAV